MGARTCGRGDLPWYRVSRQWPVAVFRALVGGAIPVGVVVASDPVGSGGRRGERGVGVVSVGCALLSGMALLAATAPPVAAAPVGAVPVRAQGADPSQTFTFTGAPQTLTVPAAAVVTITADGAGGADNTGTPVPSRGPVGRGRGSSPRSRKPPHRRPSPSTSAAPAAKAATAPGRRVPAGSTAAPQVGVIRSVVFILKGRVGVGPPASARVAPCWWSPGAAVPPAGPERALREGTEATAGQRRMPPAVPREVPPALGLRRGRVGAVAAPAPAPAGSAGPFRCVRS